MSTIENKISMGVPKKSFREKVNDVLYGLTMFTSLYAFSCSKDNSVPETTPSDQLYIGNLDGDGGDTLRVTDKGQRLFYYSSKAGSRFLYFGLADLDSISVTPYSTEDGHAIIGIYLDNGTYRTMYLTRQGVDYYTEPSDSL